MILTGQEIIKKVNKGQIIISPFDRHLVNPNSYNYRLNTKLLEFDGQTIDARKQQSCKTIHLTGKGYVLQPNKLYLASTLETIGSKSYVTSLIGRSSVGRLGLFVQITADLGNLGAIHKWTLELKTVQPLRIYPDMKIGQVSFWVPSGQKNNQYEGKYHGYNVPASSKMHEELVRKGIDL